MGWGLLNDAWEPACILGSSFSKLVLYPRLYPHFAFDTPIFRALQNIEQPQDRLLENIMLFHISVDVDQHRQLLLDLAQGIDQG